MAGRLVQRGNLSRDVRYIAPGKLLKYPILDRSYPAMAFDRNLIANEEQDPRRGLWFRERGGVPPLPVVYYLARIPSRTRRSIGRRMK